MGCCFFYSSDVSPIYLGGAGIQPQCAVPEDLEGEREIVYSETKTSPAGYDDV